MHDKLILNRGLAFAVLIGYYVLVTIPHEILGAFINKKFEVFSKETYNMIVLVAVALVLLTTLAVAWKKLRSEHTTVSRNRWLLFFGLNTVAVFLANYYLMIINIEVIHFLQYCIFAILCYTLTQNYYSILTWSIIAGAFDELHQYLVLNPTGTDYFDFNDVLINTIGAVFGILFLNLFGRKSVKMPLEDRWTSALFIFIYVLIAALIIGFVTGWASYRPEEGSKFIIYRVISDDFWSWVGKKIVYHVLMPWEYLLCTALIYIGYQPIFKGEIDVYSVRETMVTGQN